MKDSAERLSRLSERELYEELGLQLSGQAILPISRERLVEEARHWFREQKDRLRPAVCGDSKIRELMCDRSNSRRRVLLILAVADVIAGFFTGVSPFVVAALLVREGLSSFCRDIWH